VIFQVDSQIVIYTYIYIYIHTCTFWGNHLLALLGRDVKLEVSSSAARCECHELLDEPEPLLLELVAQAHVARVCPLATAVVYRGRAGTAVRCGGEGRG